MFDPDDILYDEQFNQELEKAQAELQKQKELLEQLRQTPGYQLVRTMLSERFIQRIPSIPSSKEGLYQAFGEVKFRQGMQFIFDFIENA
jgi:hypothetical protein